MAMWGILSLFELMRPGNEGCCKPLTEEGDVGKCLANQRTQPLLATFREVGDAEDREDCSGSVKMNTRNQCADEVKDTKYSSPCDFVSLPHLRHPIKLSIRIFLAT
jgi:hypothetical protein